MRADKRQEEHDGAEILQSFLAPKLFAKKTLDRKSFLSSDMEGSESDLEVESGTVRLERSQGIV